MIPRSNLRTFLKTIPFVIALVAGVRPLASQVVTACVLDPCTEAQFTTWVTSSIQPLLTEKPGKPIIMAANFEYAQGEFIPSLDIKFLLDYVDGLKAAGVQRIDINPGYLSLSPTDPNTPAIMAKYDQLVQHIRELGMMLTINLEVVPSQQTVTTFAEFQTLAVPVAQMVAARYQPDNFVIVHEPDTMNARLGIPVTVADWDGFIRTVAPLVRQSSPNSRIGAGCFYGVATQGSSDAENSYFVDFATIPDLDFLTMDIYSVTFSQFQQWVQLAHSSVDPTHPNGKGAYIEETWIPHYFANGLPSNWATGTLDQESSVGPASSDFATLYPSWIQAMANFASANGMEAVTIFTTPTFFQYGSTGADEPEEAAYSFTVVNAVELGQLTPTGQTYQTTSQMLGIPVAASLSSASYSELSSVFCAPGTNPCNADSTVAPDELVSAYGADLATSNMSATSANLPATLAGTTATLVDTANTNYPLALSFVSPHQVNFLVPSTAQPGAAALTITSADGTVTTGRVLVAGVDPGLYTANSTGSGAPAAYAVCAGTCAGWPGPPNQDGQYVQNVFAAGGLPQPISIGASDTVALVLFGTGLRHVTSTSDVTATINGQNLPVQYAGAQGQFTGEDQINVQLPNSLAGSGTVTLVLTIAVSQNALPMYDTNTTQVSNAVTIDIE
jgi:uncharacterized protein (TIGR03437 family)